MKEQGIPYFPLDVELDEKFRLIEAEYGLKGWATVVKLFQKIYGEFGYYCSSTTDMMLLFANGIKASYSFVLEITKASIKRGIFDKDMYEKYQILTSKGIQKRYFKAVSRRKHIEVDKRYLLIDIGKIQEDVNKNETVDFGEAEQTVDDVFFSWLDENIVKEPETKTIRTLTINGTVTTEWNGKPVKQVTVDGVTYKMPETYAIEVGTYVGNDTITTTAFEKVGILFSCDGVSYYGMERTSSQLRYYLITDLFTCQLYFLFL